MTFKKIVENRCLSAYKLAKNSGIPYMTINDLINKKTALGKCNAETVYKIAKALGISVEELLEPFMKKRTSFDIFKSNVCHRLKELGDMDFLMDLIEKDEITEYYDLEWYPECLYLVAMLDYISRINNIPLCSEYEFMRKLKLSGIIYPSSVVARDAAMHSDAAKTAAWSEAIPEFKRFNIAENEVRNVV